METILRLARRSGLLDLDAEALAAFRAREPAVIGGRDARIYRRSVRQKEGILYFLAASGREKSLFLVSGRTFSTDFEGTGARREGVSILKAPLSARNAGFLHQIFPFTAPVSLRDRRTTIGCGDRLGLATPGQIRAVRRFDVSPVFAQQSIRELTLTGRDYPGVVSDASFLVFQEGYEEGYGADGDHLKSLADIDRALDAGMPMVTLDLTDVMSPEPASWTGSRLDGAFQRLDAGTRRRVLETYGERSFRLPGSAVHVDATEARRCALMYLAALDHAAEADRRIRARRGRGYDLEVSIDETTAPTLPAHHVFFARELALRGVTVSSLAPRFIGEFQKGVDYRGDPSEFERQLAVHCDIARAFGGYKISVHSGSDKFSVYPAIGRQTGMRLHLKTAGTSWLQALLVIARAEPGLFRTLLDRALGSFAEASKLYRVDADPAAVPGPQSLADSQLPDLLREENARQVLHIAYGALLSDPGTRAGIYGALADHEEAHYAAVEEHMEKHLRLLGLGRRDPAAAWPAFSAGA